MGEPFLPLSRGLFGAVGGSSMGSPGARGGCAVLLGGALGLLAGVVRLFVGLPVCDAQSLLEFPDTGLGLQPAFPFVFCLGLRRHAVFPFLLHAGDVLPCGGVYPVEVAVVPFNIKSRTAL